MSLPKYWPTASCKAYVTFICHGLVWQLLGPWTSIIQTVMVAFCLTVFLITGECPISNFVTACILLQLFNRALFISHLSEHFCEIVIQLEHRCLDMVVLQYYIEYYHWFLKYTLYIGNQCIPSKNINTVMYLM